MIHEPAFPVSESNGANYGTPGMTLRDYFAAKAMQAGISHNRPAADAEGWAKWAYKMADAMLEARKETND